MKKGILCLSVITLICFSIISSLFFDHKGMRIQLTNEKKLDKIQKSAILDEEMAFSLCFQGEELPYDIGSNCFFLPLSMQDNTWEQGQITGYVMNGEIEKEAEVLFLEDFLKEDKLSLMAENKEISFIALEGNNYREYGLIITGMSLMEFSSTDQADKRGNPIFLLRVFDANEKSDKVQSCYAKGRIRGQISKKYEKKNYRLFLLEETKQGKFSKVNKNLLGMRKDDDWIINALYADGSKIRDKLANDLWNEVGANNNPYGQSFGSDFSYVEVFADGDYQGMYGLMYPIDRKQCGLKSVSSQIDAGYEVIERIYKKKVMTDWEEKDFLGELPKPKKPDYRGGFFVKGDTVLKDLSEWEPLRQMAACMEGNDTIFSETITQIASQDNILDNWLFYQAVSGFDNFKKNYYYISKNRNGSAYGYFIPWDLNLTFGEVYIEQEPHSDFNKNTVRSLVSWDPGKRMVDLDVEGSRAILDEKWEKWRKGAFSDESICDKIDLLEKTVKESGAYAREKQRWPNGNYYEDFSIIKDYSLERFAYIDEYIQEIN